MESYKKRDKLKRRKQFRELSVKESSNPIENESERERKRTEKIQRIEN